MEGVIGIDFDAFIDSSHDKLNQDYALNKTKKSDRIELHAGKFCCLVNYKIEIIIFIFNPEI